MDNFSKIGLTLHERDGSTEDIVISSPNKNPGFSWSVEGIGSSIYDDMDKKLRKGTSNKRVILYLRYSSHNIDLSRILTAEYVTFNLIEFNLPFTNRRFRFSKKSVTKNWKSGMVVSGIPSGEETLEFKSTEKYVRAI